MPDRDYCWEPSRKVYKRPKLYIYMGYKDMDVEDPEERDTLECLRNLFLAFGRDFSGDLTTTEPLRESTGLTFMDEDDLIIKCKRRKPKHVS